MGIQQFFNINPGFGADGLEHGPVLADNDSFVRIPFTVDRCIDFGKRGA